MRERTACIALAVIFFIGLVLDAMIAIIRPEFADPGGGIIAAVACALLTYLALFREWEEEDA